MEDIDAKLKYICNIIVLLNVNLGGLYNSLYTLKM